MSSPCHKCGVVTDFNGRWVCNCSSGPEVARDRQRLAEEHDIEYGAPQRAFAAGVLRKLAKSGKPVTSARLLKEAEKLAPAPAPKPAPKVPEPDTSKRDHDSLMESIRGAQERAKT